MLQTIELKLQLPQGERIHPSMGSVMHGVLMELIGSAAAEQLHTMNLRPYSQYLFYDSARQGVFWRLSALNEYAVATVLDPAMNYSGSVILEQKGYEIQITERKVVAKSSFEQLTEEAFTDRQSIRAVQLKFITPAGFKSENHYMLFPRMDLILHNLYSRWNVFAGQTMFEDPEAFKYMLEHTVIEQYDLSMRKFYIGDRARIPSFRGNIDINIYGYDTMKKLTGLLLRFSEFASIGIKTALGMGGSKVEFITEDKKARLAYKYS